MALDCVNAGTAVFASSTATFYALFPASVDSGQFLLLQVSVRNTTSTPTACTYWSSVVAADSTGTGRQWLYYCWGTSAYNGTSTTIGVSGTGVKGVRVYGFSGVATASTIFEAGSYITTSTASMHCPEVTCTTASFTCMGVAAYFVNDDNNVTAFTEMTGATWSRAYQASTTKGSDGTIGLQIATITSLPVTVTSATFRMSAADPWGIRTFALIGSSPIPTVMTEWLLSVYSTGAI
jgi:hypothetical protein